jgi:hypothetical protein
MLKDLEQMTTFSYNANTYNSGVAAPMVPRRGYFVGGKRDGEPFHFYDAEDEYEFGDETYIYAGTEGDLHIYELWKEE